MVLYYNVIFLIVVYILNSKLHGWHAKIKIKEIMFYFPPCLSSSRVWVEAQKGIQATTQS